jgi:hypothetical protein
VAPITTSTLRPARDSQRIARLGLLAVATAYVAVHFLLFDLDRPIGWDEATYFTQVARGRPAVFMEPHRTRGLVLLTAPLGPFDPSMSVLRGYLAILGGLGLFAAFATWIRTLGLAVPFAAVTFASYWVTLYYSADVLPSFPTALLAVAATGLAAAALTAERLTRRELLAAAAVMCGLALIRPPDAVLLGAGISLVILGARSHLRIIPAMAAGGFVGLVPWFLEGLVRFGFGPLALLRSGGDYSTDMERFNRLPIYLRHLEDRLRCSPSCERSLLEAGELWALPPWRTTIFLAVCLGLAAIAFAHDRTRRRELVLAAIAPVPVLIFYSRFGGITNLRYLLPVMAVWLLVPATGAVVLWRTMGRWRSLSRGLVTAVTGVMFVSMLVWQVGHAAGRLVDLGGRDRAQVLGSELAAFHPGGPCAAATDVDRPQLQYWSRCETVSLVTDEDGTIQPPLGELNSYVDLHAREREGYRIYAIAPRDLPDAHPVASWARHDFDDPTYEHLVLYAHRQGDPLPPPPCPPPDGPERMLGEVLSADC